MVLRSGRTKGKMHLFSNKLIFYDLSIYLCILGAHGFQKLIWAERNKTKCLGSCVVLVLVHFSLPHELFFRLLERYINLRPLVKMVCSNSILELDIFRLVV